MITSKVVDSFGTSMGAAPVVDVFVGGKLSVELTADFDAAHATGVTVTTDVGDLDYGQPTGMGFMLTIAPSGASATLEFIPMPRDVGVSYLSCVKASANNVAAQPLLVCIKYRAVVHVPTFVAPSPAHGEVIDAPVGRELVASLAVEALIDGGCDCPPPPFPLLTGQVSSLPSY